MTVRSFLLKTYQVSVIYGGFPFVLRVCHNAPVVGAGVLSAARNLLIRCLSAALTNRVQFALILPLEYPARSPTAADIRHARWR